MIETDDQRFHAEVHHQPLETEVAKLHELTDTLSKLKYALRNILLKEDSSFIHSIDPKNKTLSVTCTFGTAENRKEIRVVLPAHIEASVVLYNVAEAITEMKRQKEELLHS